MFDVRVQGSGFVMRVLVTGGTGFLGSAVCRLLVQQRGATVLNVDNPGPFPDYRSVREVAANPRYGFRRGEVCDRPRMAALLQTFAPEAVIHTPADRSAPAWVNGPSQATTDPLATWRLLEATSDYWAQLSQSQRARFRFVLMAHGTHQAGPERAGAANVLATRGRHHPREQVKRSADRLAIDWQRAFGLPVIVANSAVNYGPWQAPEATCPRLIVDALEGRSPTLQAVRSEPHDWMHVEDLAAALDAMVRHGRPGETYDVGGGVAYLAQGVAGRIKELVDKHTDRPVGRGWARMATLAKVEAEPTMRGLDTGKLRNDTGWQPRVALEAGLAKTVSWYLSNAWWWRPMQHNVPSADRNASA